MHFRAHTVGPVIKSKSGKYGNTYEEVVIIIIKDAQKHNELPKA